VLVGEHKRGKGVEWKKLFGVVVSVGTGGTSARYSLSVTFCTTYIGLNALGGGGGGGLGGSSRLCLCFLGGGGVAFFGGFVGGYIQQPLGSRCVPSVSDKWRISADSSTSLNLIHKHSRALRRGGRY